MLVIMFIYLHSSNNKSHGIWIIEFIREIVRSALPGCKLIDSEEEKDLYRCIKYIN